MADLIQNTNPKHNPITTIVSVVFFTISFVLFVAPYFVTLKEKVEWYVPLIAFVLGLLSLFMNDEYFSKLFSFGLKVGQKKTGTDQ